MSVNSSSDILDCFPILNNVLRETPALLTHFVLPLPEYQPKEKSSVPLIM